MELMIVTGMSGAGKSQATNALEDIGYYCVDNMPPTLMLPFLQLCRQSTQPLDKVALVTDVRSGLLFEEFLQVLPTLEANVEHCHILFLDCHNETLSRRFKETRRQHPLAEDGRPIEQALQLERQMLSPLFEMADYRIDTTHLNTAQLKSRLADLFMTQPDTAMTVQILSFGFKYGYPAEADLMLDMRCLPNPYYVEELRHQTGMDSQVQEYVMRNPDAVKYLEHIKALLSHTIPLYQKEGRTQLVVAIGCTGGKHRSVTMVNQLAAELEQLTNLRVLTYHRDLGRE
ncbi:MAG: RNase adapter RapZ [Ruminococcaceae bacterium]|nr:RNase adapter RapZ [Oscillospiraceae bacterium]